MSLMGGISVALAVLAMLATAYQIVALMLVRQFFAAAAAPVPDATPVSLLKPLYGDEPHLTANLASFFATAHAGPLQMVCGVNEPRDSAVRGVEVLQRALPDADIALSKGPRGLGRNGKVGNLIAMLPLAKHDVLVLSDSDMAVAPDYLPRVLDALHQPGIGAVSCLYAGRGDSGFWSQLGAAAISYSMMPNMVVGLKSGLAQPCMGSTIALRRETLRRIGGFHRFAETLADDHAIGAAVAAQGLKVAVPPVLLVHAGTEQSLPELWRHHLRWAVTIRGVAGAGHWGSLVTHAVPLALLALLLHPIAGGLTLVEALTTRIALARIVDRIHGRRSAPLWMVPLADCLGFVVFCASLMARQIEWRGHRLTMEADGRIAA